ncbi:hypothetical protein [Nostoc sp.]
MLTTGDAYVFAISATPFAISAMPTAGYAYAFAISATPFANVRSP